MEPSQQGFLFANHIRELGEQGFADWLVKCFCCTQSGMPGDYFQYNHDGTFADAMGEVIEEFDDEVARIGLVATQKARAQITRHTDPYGKMMLEELEQIFQTRKSPFR